ncbi:MAG: divergent polysaccharide deacetylase family protein [Thiohalobacteraceae bacterium]
MTAGHGRRVRRPWPSSAAAAGLMALLPAWLTAAGHLPAVPEPRSAMVPEIAIIIDDMGTRLDAGRRVIGLPGPVTCAFLPYAPHTAALARQAHRRDKEVMLHLPMATVEDRPLDQGGLTLDMTEEELHATLAADLARVPYAVGVNNHMGSLLTRHPGHMLWLMRALQRREGMFFVDSRTTRHTVAQLLAYENAIPSVSRDVFLDAEPTPEGVRREFQRLLGLARRNGSALAIGHPHAATLELLEQELPRLEGVRLVPISRLVERQHEREHLWRASLSP